MQPIIVLSKYTPKLENILLNYLDQNRKFNVELDPLKLRIYEKDWAIQQKQKLLSELEKNNGEILFIKLDENIIGFISYYIKKSKHKVAQISRFFIEQNYRGKGFGKDVLNILSTRLKEKGYKYLSLKVFKPNQNAYAFYKKFEFEERFVSMIKKI